jgi:glucosylceramidase
MTFPFFIRLGVLLLLGAVSLSAQSPTPKVRWICSTEQEPWKEMSNLSVINGPASGTGVVPMQIDPTVKFQKNLGVGACFNELAWTAMEPLSASQRDEVFQALFGPSGCNLSACREGIGANDFAAPVHKGAADNDAWYSLDETPGDYAMAHFTLDEDRKILIPFIKEAMKYQPKLQIWGVPWSPPSWMKTTGKYKGGMLKQDPQTLQAYALYFAKYAQNYLHEGIPLRAVMPQNEPSFNSGKYPQCHWKGIEIASCEITWSLSSRRIIYPSRSGLVRLFPTRLRISLIR